MMGRARRFLPLLALLAYAAQRLWFAMSGRCPVDSDEGVFGIMAIRALRGEFHPFFLGQDYLGSFQALVAAPVMLLAGKTPMALRLTAVAEGVAVLLIWRRLFARMGLPHAWWFFALLLAFATEYATNWTARCRGIVEVLLLGSAWLLAMAEIAASEKPFARQTWRWAVAGLLGGVAWWTSQLVVFFFVPGVAAFLCARGSVARMREGFTRAGVAAIAALALALVLLVLRASVPYNSAASAALYEARGGIAFVFLAALAGAAACAWRRSLPRWPVAAILAFVVGSLPAVLVSLSKPVLYNTTHLQPPYQWLTTAGFLVFEGSATLLGLSDSLGYPLGLPVWTAVAMGCACGLALVASAVGLRHRVRSGALPTADGFFLGATLFAFLMLLFTIRPTDILAHYAVLAVFFGTGLWACFLARLWEMGAQGAGARALAPRAVACALFLLLAGVHLAGTMRARAVPVHPLTGVTRDEQATIDFLLERDLTIGATSLGDSSGGYWDAYRLTIASGERVRLHPVLHMPRVAAYREVLRAAPRAAIVGWQLDGDARTLERHGIPYRRDIAGGMTILWDFDKARVDALGLWNYAAEIEIPE